MKYKRITLRCLALMLMLILGATSVFAEKVTLKIGSGSQGGVYFPVVQQMIETCSSPTLGITHNIDPQTAKSIGGTDNNKRNLLGNKIQAGIMQMDGAMWELMNNKKMERIQSLITLHDEQIHPITYSLVKKSSKGLVGKYFGSDEIVRNPLEYLSDLKGHRVAAWGGSTTTCKYLKLMADIGMEIVPVHGTDSKKEYEVAMEMLDAGRVSAVIAVVGAPAKWIEDLPRNRYKLLKVKDETKKKLVDIFGVSSVSYDNMGEAGQSVETLSVGSDLFTREYHTPEMINALSELKNCVQKNIYKIRDTGGTHPIWQEIDPFKETKWKNVFQGSKKK